MIRSTLAETGRFIVDVRERLLPAQSKRVLINEILSIQILSTAVIGALAVAGLYWGGQWVLQDNYSRWALQWTEELNELGAPLYLADDSESVLRLESYIEKYPEIGSVTYYRSDGSAMFSIERDGSDAVIPDLPVSLRDEAAELIAASRPYLLESSVLDPRQFEILAPMWTESIADDGLFAFDSSATTGPTKTELVGFVGLHLDFIVFHDRLLTNIKAAIVGLLFLLIASALYGRRALRKALASISDLQQPIQELAKGNLDVEFQPAQHREISEIVEALETTATALSERDARLSELANHDSLTGLYNRWRFVEELKQELDRVVEEGFASALLFVDLDQFKYVNDTCGHPAGDRLLTRVADELVRVVGSGGTVARFGGDEFAILISDVSRSTVSSLGKSLLEAMRSMSHVEGDRVFHVHCSIGITMINGSELDHDELIAQADIACRDAKLGGRNRLQFYQVSERKAQRLISDVGWMNTLRSAIDNDGFELRFQPINCIATGRTLHHEALLRLPAENDELIRPDAFLAAAARFGLMTEIDFWVIRNAAAAFRQHWDRHPQLKLAINLSAHAFDSDDLVSYVQRTFAEHEVPASHIVFEITESLAVRRPRHVEKKIAALRTMGCELALDDFGTGYSSFGYLQRLHFDYIKIDGAFVHDLPNNPVDQKMIKLIAEIGREANMRTIAEYVQSAECLLLLGELGVDMAQGYYVGRPTRDPMSRSTPVSIASQRDRRSTSA